MRIKKVKRSLAMAIVTIIATLSALSIFNARYYLKADSDPNPADTVTVVTVAPEADDSGAIKMVASDTAETVIPKSYEENSYEDDPIFTAEQKHVILDAAYEAE